MTDLQAQIVTNQGQTLAVLQAVENRMKAIQIATAKANATAKDYQRTVAGTDLKKVGEVVGRGTGVGGQVAGNIFKGAADGSALGKVAIAMAGITGALVAINRANEVALGIAEERLAIEKRVADVNKDIARTKDSIASKGEAAAANRRAVKGAGGQDALDLVDEIAGQLGDPAAIEAGVKAAFNKAHGNKTQANAMIDVARRVALAGGDFAGAVDEAAKYPVMLGNGKDQYELAKQIHAKQTGGGNLDTALRNIQGDDVIATQEDVNATRVQTRNAQISRFTSRGRDMAMRELGETQDPENTARQKLTDEINAEIERKKRLAQAESVVIAFFERLGATLGMSPGDLGQQAARTQAVAADNGLGTVAPRPAAAPSRVRLNVSASAPGGLVEYQP